MIIFRTDEPNVPKPGKIVLVDKTQLLSIMNEQFRAGSVVRVLKDMIDPNTGAFTINQIERLTNGSSGIAAKIADIKVINGKTTTIIELPYITINEQTLKLTLPYDDTVVVSGYVTDDNPYKYGPIQLANTIWGVDIIHKLNEFESHRIVDEGLSEFDVVSKAYWDKFIDLSDTSNDDEYVEII